MTFYIQSIQKDIEIYLLNNMTPLRNDGILNNTFGVYLLKHGALAELK